ncbi:outer membrane beta-barrel protein [Telluribacter sp. SYSU D00476]|uniref:outer membrane beta-barrel protein n=1 Tax=Telluribacter sp. SYSU D00476 TaxID=2811430 RepID=UPI001FF5ABB0|nr:outer membrane beta-barrel protein [Telluribacter sp. SYSU D00476]
MLSLRHWPVLLLFFTGFFFNSAWAQSRFSVAPVVAPFSSYAEARLKEPHRFQYSTGLSLGATAHYHFSPVWSLATGLWYQWAYVNGQTGTNFELFRIKEQYLEFPLLLNYRPTARKVSPYFSAGMLLSKQPGYYRSLVSKVQLGAGVSYQLNQRLAVVVQPTLVLGSDKYARHYPPKRLLSLQTQLVYHLARPKQKE